MTERQVLFLIPIFIFQTAIAQNTFDARFVEYTGLRYVCGADGLTPVVKILNEGSATMATCVVETWKNGLMVNTFDWNLAVPAMTGEVRQPALPVIADAEEGDTYEFHIISVNGEPDEGPEGNMMSITLDDVPVDLYDNMVTVKVMTGSVQSDLTWQVKNELAQVIASGGPYSTTFTGHDTLLILDAFSCYQLVMSVTGEAGFPMGSVALENNGAEVFIITGESIGALEQKGFRTGGAMSVYDGSIGAISIFPNPTNGVVRITSADPYSLLEIYDVTGRSIRSMSFSSATEVTLDFASFGSGIYPIGITNSNGMRSVSQVIVE